MLSTLGMGEIRYPSSATLLTCSLEVPFNLDEVNPGNSFVVMTLTEVVTRRPEIWAVGSYDAACAFPIMK